MPRPAEARAAPPLRGERPRSPLAKAAIQRRRESANRRETTYPGCDYEAGADGLAEAPSLIFRIALAIRITAVEISRLSTSSVEAA